MKTTPLRISRLRAALASTALGLSSAAGQTVLPAAPVRLCAGPEARICATDARARSILVFDQGLNLLYRFRGPDRPLGIAVAKSGDIYVGDDGRGCVAVYDPSGRKLREVGTGVISKPNDLVLDFDERLYVADSLSDAVRVFDAAGNALATFGSRGSGPGQFLFPSALAIACAGPPGQGSEELFVADQGNCRVQVFSRSGALLRTFGSQVPSGSGADWHGRFAKLQSLAVDNQYRVHAVDSYLNHVQILSATDGSFIAAYGGFGTGQGQLNLPLHVLITDSARVLIANYGNGRVESLAVLTNLVVVLSGSSVRENLAPGTPVGTLSVTPPTADRIAFALVAGLGDEDNALFRINGRTLETAATFDYETKNVCRIRVKALGPAPLNFNYAQPLTISVGDVNESPTGVTLDNTSVQEGLAVGSVVGRLAAVDPDQSDGFAFSLVAGAGDAGNAFFQIRGDRLLTAAVLSHQAAHSHSVRVQVRDAAGQPCATELTVAVLPVAAIDLTDGDGDGLPDWWELRYGGGSMDPAADSDGDGKTNFEEWIAGTDPADAALHLALTSCAIDPLSGLPVLGWPSAAGRLYSVEYTDDLDLPFTTVADDLAGNPPVNLWRDTAPRAVHRGFYRLKVRLNLQSTNRGNS